MSGAAGAGHELPREPWAGAEGAWTPGLLSLLPGGGGSVVVGEGQPDGFLVPVPVSSAASVGSKQRNITQGFRSLVSRIPKGCSLAALPANSSPAPVLWVLT